jgi:DNA-binding FrmR family transcriptional regulator
MSKAVQNLDNRVTEIEGKIKSVEAMLKDQNNIIRGQVGEEKKNWL